LERISKQRHDNLSGKKVNSIEKIDKKRQRYTSKKVRGT
jgi:hypothetical protein